MKTGFNKLEQKVSDLLVGTYNKMQYTKIRNYGLYLIQDIFDFIACMVRPFYSKEYKAWIYDDTASNTYIGKLTKTDKILLVWDMIWQKPAQYFYQIWLQDLRDELKK